MDELSGDEWQVCGGGDGSWGSRRGGGEGNIRENSPHPRLQPNRGFLGPASLTYR